MAYRQGRCLMISCPPRAKQTSRLASAACQRCISTTFSSSPSSSSPQDTEAQDAMDATPRWSVTPAAMRAPHSVRPDSQNRHFTVNENPKKLDTVYVNMLGEYGDRMLPEEVKWLAVTHKTFDHGRRGFNDRLASLGRRIVELQGSLALRDASRPASNTVNLPSTDSQARTTFVDNTLANVEAISKLTKDRLLSRSRLAQLATQYGLTTVIRWKPRQVHDLKESGLDVVLAQTIYAIVGAVALQQGGEVANALVRRRVLTPLGLI